MDKLTIQVRSFVSENVTVVVTLLVITALFGGYVIYNTQIEPGTETEQYEESSWSSTAEFTHSAVVIEETDIFDEGDVLENRATYIEQLAPVTNGTFSYQYEASDGGEVNVTTILSLVLRSTAEGDDDETIEYWRIDEELGSNSTEVVTPGEVVEVPFNVNVSAANARIEEIEDQIGSTPGETEVLVLSENRVSGVRNGSPVETAETYEASIDVSENVYSVANTGPHSESDETIGERSVQATYGPLRSYGGPILFVFSILGLLGLAAGWWWDRLSVSDEEREWLEYQSTRDEFDEWITRANIPDEALQMSEISVETLRGLADVAIDSNRRVIEDMSHGACFVLLENRAYRFEIPDAVLTYHRQDSLPLAPGPDEDLTEPVNPEYNGDTLERDELSGTRNEVSAETEGPAGDGSHSDGAPSPERESEE